MRFIGNAPVDGEVRVIASGALATGDAVVVNSDATVSVVAGVDEGVGSPVVFEDSSSTIFSAAYDANAQKVVIAYRNTGNSNYGTAVVGTVSGTSISFGSPVVFNTETTIYISTTYDANTQKVVIAYQDIGNSRYGTAIVGTVSGTSISFGSPSVFNSSNTYDISTTYDVVAQKVVIAYNNISNGVAIIGTVSGTSISFGTPVVFYSARADLNAAIYDSNAQKVVIAYQDAGNLDYGTAIVGTVSGTSISFGSSVVFSSSSTPNLSATYDSNAQSVVIVYEDKGNSEYGTAIVGTVSGTSISFGSSVVFYSAAINTLSATYAANAKKVVIAYRDASNSYRGMVITSTVNGTSISFGSPSVFNSANSVAPCTIYDLDAEKTIIAYNDTGNSGHGTALVFEAGSTNLTSENFVGFANSGYADGQSAAINSTCMVDSNQTSLTAGQTYYVQTSGALGTTPADPSVVAGTAISSNSIIVKG